jgi:uncharacterized protein (TIGR03437 family)
VIDPSVDQSKIDIQGLWATRVLPKLVAISGRHKLPKTIGFIFGKLFETDGDYPTYENPVVEIGRYPFDKTDLNDNVYNCLTYEAGHALSPFGGFGSPVYSEGLAYAMTAHVYQQLHAEDASILPITNLFISDSLNNTNWLVTAGGEDFYSNFGAYFMAAGGIFETILQDPGDFIRSGQAVEDAGFDINWTEYVPIFNQVFAGRKINGVSAGTYLDRIVSTREMGPDGTFFGVEMDSNPAPNIPWGMNTYAAVNPVSFTLLYFQRQGVQGTASRAVTQTHLPATVTWWVTFADGTTVVPKTTTNIKADPGTNYVLIPYPFSWAEGAYMFHVCSDLGCDVAHFAVLHRDWTFGTMIIITNGPEFADLAVRADLQYDSSLSVEKLPGLLLVSNPTQDVVLHSAGDGKTYTFSPHRTVSAVYLLTQRDQPYIDAAADGATYVTTLTAGGWASLFGWAFSHDDPVMPYPFVASCGNLAGVVFTDDHGDHPGAISYCSNRQVNAQVPVGLSGPVTVKAVLGTTGSNPVGAMIADINPGIFMVQYPDLGAIIFQNGQLADAQHPIHPATPDSLGDIISIYAAGLGPVNPSTPATGQPAPFQPLDHTNSVVHVIVDEMDCPVYYSGLAPGLVGLYQVNVAMGVGMTPGDHWLVLHVGDKTSNKVKISVQ